MKKLTSIPLIIIVMILLGITSLAEARTGKTSDSSSSSSSKSHTTSSKTTTSSSSVSKPTKTTSATDSIFANIAKTNAAKKAWQERNKKPVDNAPVVATVPVPAPDNSATRRQEQQLADIQKQIADAKRQQQIIAAAQTAAQIALNNNKRPQPVPVAPIPTPTNAPVSTSTDTAPAPADSGDTSWFMIFLMLGGMVLIFFWFKKRNTSNTIYRL